VLQKKYYKKTLNTKIYAQYDTPGSYKGNFPLENQIRELQQLETYLIPKYCYR